MEQDVHTTQASKRRAPRVAAPYADAEAHLADWLGVILLCVQRHIVRHRHRLLQASGKLSNLFVSVDEVNALLADGGARKADSQTVPSQEGWPSAAELTEQIAAARAVMEASLELTRRGGDEVSLPIEELRASASLDETELTLLLATAAPLLSVDLARLYTFAWADFAVKRPSVGFLAELVADEDDPSIGGAVALIARFREGGRLAGRGLVVVEASAAWGRANVLLHQSAIVPEPLLATLRGQARDSLADMPAELAVACRLSGADAAKLAPADFTVGDATRDQLLSALRQALRSRDGRPRLVLCGPQGSGRRSLLAAYLAGVGRGLITVDLSILARDEDRFDERLRSIQLHALLQNAALLLRGDDLFDDVDRWGRLGHRLAAFVNRHRGLIALSAAMPNPELHNLLDDAVIVSVPRPSQTQQIELWRRQFAALEEDTDDELPELLARRFDLTAGHLARAVSDAVGQTRARRRSAGQARSGPGLEDVRAAIKQRMDHSLAALAEPIETPLDWDDVVLPEETLGVLQEILTHARHRVQVYDTWGFRKKTAYGTGLSCLFAGPPGTGKTMMAGVLAKSLGQDMYRVDLSKVVSKWVGETEKNLGRIFEEAQTAQAILLFDEADSLFSQRTSVQSSNDRFANMEVNYLLQRMENYEGTTILTTNFAESLDQAFKRRIKFRVHFPVPDAEQRARLWRAMIPPSVVLADDVSFDALARDVELSGGSIKNAVLRAAFAAVDDGGVIRQSHLRTAARAEGREMGLLVRSDDPPKRRR